LNWLFLIKSKTYQKLFNMEKWGRLRKRNINGVNLIEVHCIHVINITMKSFVQLTYANKKLRKIKYYLGLKSCLTSLKSSPVILHLTYCTLFFVEKLMTSLGKILAIRIRIRFVSLKLPVRIWYACSPYKHIWTFHFQNY
jgi:hypothetical protein